jgi:hypothetical protein
LLRNCDVGTKEVWTNNPQQFIANIMKCCDEEAEQKYLRVSVAKAPERAAEYCNISSRTIQGIRNGINNCVTD